MRLAKLAARVPTIAVAAVAAATMMGGGVARAADTPFDEIRPVFSAFQVWPSSDECLALDAGGGLNADHTRVWQWNCNGHADQKWSLHLVTASAVAGNLYQIINQQSGKCMEVRAASSSNGVQVDQITCDSRGYSGQRQLWMAVRAGNDEFGFPTFALQPFSAFELGWSKCLDVWNFNSGDGAAITQWACNGGANQRFYLFGGDPPIS